MSAGLELTQNSGGPSPAVDLQVLFNTSDYFDVSATSPNPHDANGATDNVPFGNPYSLHGELEEYASDTAGKLSESIDAPLGKRERLGSFDHCSNTIGFGGELLAGDGMDTVSDGLRGPNEQHGL